jgi:murein DD-endopeptidase MepM/ murein hydrolase activator NlpD
MKRYFPLDKPDITINDSNTDFAYSYSSKTEIPKSPHPGSFGYVRKNHIHEGVDLYANDGDNVYAIEDGTVTAIIPFTGEIADSPWWNNTYSILINHKTCALNYGELIPSKDLKVGDTVNAGDIIGQIRTVLKKDKGRPMSMLHIEMYKLGTQEPIKEWSLNTEKPEQLIDPTDLLIEIAIYRG